MAELNLIQELELAVAYGEDDSRLAALLYTTDLLVVGRYEDDDVWIFGEVIGLLADEIEASARAQLAGRLASCAHAPANIIDKLACDDAIEVARPVLRHSDRISDNTLLHVARTKSQEHLLAISERSSLHEGVTDILLARGNSEVVHSVAKNPGARFSDSGFWKLVQRCENDVVLTLKIGGRKDIPRHHFQKLIAKASDEVRTRLAAVNPGVADEICGVVADVAGSVHARFGPATRSYFAAKRAVGEMHRRGALTAEALHEFARARKAEEVTVALSLLCELPVNIVERALNDEQSEIILVIAKATNLPSATARLLLLMRPNGMAPHDLDEATKGYSQLGVRTARQVISFYRARHGSDAPPQPGSLG